MYPPEKCLNMPVFALKQIKKGKKNGFVFVVTFSTVSTKDEENPCFYCGKSTPGLVILDRRLTREP